MPLPRIALTMGDPAGIGPEVALAAMADGRVQRACAPLLLGDAGVLQRVAEQCRLSLPPRVVPLSALRAEASVPPFLVDLQAIAADAVVPGEVSGATGAASYRYIEAAIDAARCGAVEAVVTGPIHKEALRASGVEFPGHTEIFAAKTDSTRACMMLTSRELTCSFVTTHVGYRDVPQLLSVERILDVIELSRDAMQRIRGRRPRLAVCGLNPHAGERGLFGGGEEERFIIPAVDAARAKGIDIVGPLPPDTAFLPRRRAVTDCFVCMYHDQGHIPLKALAFDLAVNMTLGLPIIRTSVDHGTALDIAWQGRADVSSMIEAVMLAAKLAGGGPEAARGEPLAAGAAPCVAPASEVQP